MNNKLEAVEKNFNRKNNELFKYVESSILSMNDIDSRLEDINAKGAENIDSDDFILLGLLSYWVGIGYCNQQQLTEKICVPLAERFKKIEFSELSANNFVEIISKIKIDRLEIIKKEIMERFTLENVTISKTILDHINNIINNSIVSTNLVVDIRNIIKPPFTYQDILKINGIVSKQCEFTNIIATRAYINLYGNQEFSNIFDQALQEFDNQKYAVIYLDGIISLFESLSVFNMETLKNVILGKITEYPEIIDKKETPKEEVPAEKTPKEEITPSLSDAEVKDLMTNSPIKFVFSFLADSIGKTCIENNDGVIYAIDNLIDNSDLIQHIYQYIRNYETKSEFFTSELIKNGIPEGVEIEKLVSILETKLNSVNEKIKNSTEIICQPINSDEIERLGNYINAVIGDLILSSDEEKQYLISQYMENGISTYKHLQQILNIIENTKMIGKNSKSYIVLDSYIKDAEHVTDIFEESYELEPLQIKSSVYQGFHKFFNNCITVPTK